MKFQYANAVIRRGHPEPARMQQFALMHNRSHLAVIQETKQCEKAGGGFSQWHRYVTEWTTDE